MSADDQVFLDVLSSIPNDIRRYSADVADYIDKHVEHVAGLLREQLSSARWLPESVRPLPPPPPPPPTSPLDIIPLSSTYEKVEDWVSRHRYLTGLVVVVAGAVIYRSYRRSRFCRRAGARRARRARNGGRLEVVVVAGSPSLPLTKSLALDLERRGHIVYVVCNSAEDEALVHHLARADIKSLTIDVTDPPSAGASIERFSQYLQVPHAPVSRAKANYLSLKAVILVPSVTYQASPIATIPPSSFADLFNTHLLHPILTVQAFLPLLTARLTAPPQTTAQTATAATATAATTPPKVLVFTPSIISSINPPFHAPEATVCSALGAFTEVLAAELRPLSIPVTHVQLGSFDMASFTPAASMAGAAAASRAASVGRPQLPAPDGSEAWPEPARRAYGRNFSAQTGSAVGTGRVRGLKPSSLRELHNVVFDVMESASPPAVVRVGLGADLYGFVGRWVPRGLVAWMMGVRRVEVVTSDGAAASAWHQYVPSSGSSADGASPRSGSENGDFISVTADGVSGSDSLHGAVGADAHVWRTAAL